MSIRKYIVASALWLSAIPALHAQSFEWPADLHVSHYSSTAAELFWSRATFDNGASVAGYEIILNGQSLGVHDVTSWFVDDLSSGADYDWAVAAVSSGGERSTLATIDVTAEQGYSPNGDTPFEVKGQTIRWPAEQWYQVQSSDGAKSLCDGGLACTVQPGAYIVINHNTGTRYNNVTVGVPDSSGISVSGHTISWTGNGWHQVQSNDGSQTFCNGGTSCEVPPGNYLIINHATGQRFDNITVPQSSSDHPTNGDTVRYEVWASDQSNSVADAGALGVKGSYIWIWDSLDIEAQIAGGPQARPLSCSGSTVRAGSDDAGPCDLIDVFPQSLQQLNDQGETNGITLGELNGFGRLHGMLPDPQNRYFNVNIFAPGGGFVGIMDARSKSAVALFRVTGTNVAGPDTRSVHMSFWNKDGSAILVANLNGKMLERIDITRDEDGNITDAVLNRAASLGVGKGLSVTSAATAFSGLNAHGRPLIGRAAGEYNDAALSDLTPNALCKEDGCAVGEDVGRPNNVIICPIVSKLNDNVYVTMGGGGMLIVNSSKTPMSIVGEYDRSTYNAAGCGGGHAGDSVWMNSGVSASGAGASWSTFTVYRFDDTAFDDGTQPLNQPAPDIVFKDEGNTATGGNGFGPDGIADGQLPGSTVRRDAHGMDITRDGRYMHVVDRIQNVMEVFDTQTLERTTYDLVSADGQGEGSGPCDTVSVVDDAGLPGNDPAPDLFELTPDGRYLMIAFRGPAPVSVNHSAQGSCPGVGVVQITQNGASGRLATVLRTTNTVDNATVSAPGGHDYLGAERSDVHGAAVILRDW
ncbi:MAG: fibronectin type III domain-containing protein [Granulosicoccus sp.]